MVRLKDALMGVKSGLVRLKSALITPRNALGKSKVAW